jgi:hypothetical protein
MLNKVISTYFIHTATIRSNETIIKGHIEPTRETLYTDIPCYVYKQSDWQANLLFGTDTIGRYKIELPKQVEIDEVITDITIKEKYLIEWTDSNSDTHKFIVHSVSNYETHIEADIEEVQ